MRFQIESLRPVAIHLRGVGPFQGEEATTIEFTDGDRPCNIFILLSENGRGKTTVMESMFYLMSLLGRGVHDTPPPEWLYDYRDARMQLDVLIKIAGEPSCTLLSLLAGSSASSDMDPGLKAWGHEELARLNVAAHGWRRFGHGSIHGPRKWIGGQDEFIQNLLTYISESSRRGPEMGEQLEESVETTPTLLYFTSYRDLARPGPPEERHISRPGSWTYQVARRYDRESQGWQDSVDQLLVWLYWLDGDGGRFKRAQEILNKRVFHGSNKYLEGIRKDPPEAIVSNGHSRHRLDQLSSGEKSLVQLFLRIAAHMTLNTIVLIDELDLHLHPRWERSMVSILKDLAATHPGLTIMFSVHSREVLEKFDIHLEEPSLCKGGFIIEDEEA